MVLPPSPGRRPPLRGSGFHRGDAPGSALAGRPSGAVPLGVLVVAATVMGGCSVGDDRTLRESVLDSVRAAPGRAADYQPLDPAAAQRLGLAVAALAVGADLDEPPNGYRQVTAVEEGDEELLVLEEVPDDGRVPGHGLYAVRPGAGGGVVVQVPHPVADLDSETLGTELFQRAGADVLMVAGAHRRAGDSAGDVAHEAGSAFAAVDRAVVGRGSTIVQVHGFAADGYPDSYGDVVLSSTDADPSQLVLDVAEALRAADVEVCVYDGDRCSRLAGTTNMQAAHARAVGADFLHVEISDASRADEEQTAAVIAALADVIHEQGAMKAAATQTTTS